MSRWRRYPEYKDSGVEWLGEVPEGWAIVKLKYLTKKSKEINGSKPVGEMLAVSGYSGIIPKKYEYEERKRTNEDLMQYLVVHPGQLVANTMWLNYSGIGVSEYQGHVSPAYSVFNITDDFEKKFLHHLMRSANYISGYCSKLFGIRPNSLQVSTYDLDNLPILSPPISEQCTIAAVLNCENARIDSLIVKRKLQIEILKEKRAAQISKAVTQGLNPSIKMKTSGIGWIGNVPEHWIITKLRRFCWLQQGLQIPQIERFYEPNDDRMEYITIQSIHTDQTKLIKEYIEKPQKRVICDPEDILFVRTGATGEVVTNQTGVFHNNFFKVIYDKKKINRDFLVYFLKNPVIIQYFKLMAGTTTIPDLNHDEFLDAPFILPELNEQNAIVNFLNIEGMQIENCEQMLQKSITILTEYRSALISAAVTGKIDVRAEAR